MKSELWHTPARDECPHPELWHARDDQATETEVSVMIGAIAYGLRARRVLETGAYLGDTTEALGRALDGFGHVDAVEVDHERASFVRGRVAALPVTVHACSSLELGPVEPYDLCFFDSSFPDRYEEFRVFRNPGATWILHDARHVDVQLALDILRHEGVIGDWVYFSTPRGLAVGRFP